MTTRKFAKLSDTFATAVRLFSRNVPQYRLAGMIGISGPTLSAAIHGKQRVAVTDERWTRLASIIGVHPDDVFAHVTDDDNEKYREESQ